MDDPVGIQEFLEKHPMGFFKPIVWYNRHMNRITFQNRDCSCTEVELNPLVKILEDNYPEPGQPKYCGFLIENARMVMKNCDWPASTNHSLVELITLAMANFPAEQGSLRLMLDVFGAEIARHCPQISLDP